MQQHAPSHPYLLTLPADDVSAPFAPAQRPWDGEGTITRDSTYIDRVTTRNGPMYIFGIAWDDDAEALAQMFTDRQADAHGCSSELANRRDVTIDATPAVGFFTSSCGPQD